MKILWNFLRRSLEEAHRELRTMQEGGSVEHVQINAELRSLLQRTFRIEKGSFKDQKLKLNQNRMYKFKTKRTLIN